MATNPMAKNIINNDSIDQRQYQPVPFNIEQCQHTAEQHYGCNKRSHDGSLKSLMPARSI